MFNQVNQKKKKHKKHKKETREGLLQESQGGSHCCYDHGNVHNVLWIAADNSGLEGPDHKKVKKGKRSDEERKKRKKEKRKKKEKEKEEKSRLQLSSGQFD
jgi:mediator of RNA polymerase II transcription subunit 19